MNKSNDAKWGGCATLNAEDPKLWICPRTDRGRTNHEVSGFSLAEVIEAGLRQKVHGLSDADRDAAIADCVADTLHHIKSLSRELAEAQVIVSNCAEQWSYSELTAAAKSEIRFYENHLMCADAVFSFWNRLTSKQQTADDLERLKALASGA
ncbi:hypothetical protein [Burkholderia vietnamiensis]|uniref:hypothetical protein n=1 Tax=Burkholderia vietnamiensis TaxID=60552 RepID=UPI0015933B47|nr:hypothetical protein [Burkholderia vietnamiensis]